LASILLSFESADCAAVRFRKIDKAMETMPFALDWSEIATRLACAIVAGTAFGLNRTEAGKVAGLRTTLLVCLAACLAMLQANALLAQSGKHPDSFVQLDVMRLPLGILTGMGFIGAGAVMRKNGLVIGVTTAAMLWFVTVIGLCIGGGQYRLAASGTGIGVVVLWGVRNLEHKLKRQKRAWLTVEYDRDSACRPRLEEELRRFGCTFTWQGSSWRDGAQIFEERLLVRWREGFDVDATAPAFTDMARVAGARSVRWSIVEE
jgi:putative Mg2+ transporter-C (MgtC) family protein